MYDLLQVGVDRGAFAAGLIPHFDGTDSVLLAVGILGATVMPHVVYLHSALTSNRIAATSTAEKRELLRFQRLDVVLAMGLAGFINLTHAGRGGAAVRPERELDRGAPTPASRRCSAAARRSRSRSRCWPPGCRARASARTPARS